jgi:acyl carrier protein
MDDLLQERINRRKQILTEIKEELADRLQLEVSPENIDDDTYLFGGGLQLDSIDSMEIIIGMQAKFGVEVPEGDVAPLRTINTLADLVEEHQPMAAHQAA